MTSFENQYQNHLYKKFFFSFKKVISKKISETRDKDTIAAVLPIPVDADTWSENRIIRYKLVQTTDTDNTFRLNETSGELVLLKELDYDRQRTYQFTIKATSRVHWTLDQPIDYTNPTLLNVTLHVVRDRLLVEFIDDLHFVNVNLEQDTAYQSRSVFYSKAYLINRKLLNEVRFRIDGLEVKKPSSLVRVKPSVTDKVIRIDRTDGRVYLNRTELTNEGFGVDDRLRVRIVANLYALTGAPLSADNEHENDKYLIDNSMTRLEIRLTNFNSSILMVLNNLDMKEIQLSYLNPNDARYISRTFGPIGFRPVVQDIIEPVITAATLRSQPFNLLMQFSNLTDVDNMNNFDSDEFVATLKKNSMRLGSSFEDKNVEFKAAIKSEHRQAGNDFYDLFDLTKPFYMSWMFWMLALIGMLLFVIMVMFVFCIKLNAKQARSTYNRNKSGLVIEYPPGVNPIFEDGVLKLDGKRPQKQQQQQQQQARKSPARKVSNGLSRVHPVDLLHASDFEDQEMEMRLDEISDEE